MNDESDKYPDEQAKIDKLRRDGIIHGKDSDATAKELAKPLMPHVKTGASGERLDHVKLDHTQVPSVNRIALYRLTDREAVEINERRASLLAHYYNIHGEREAHVRRGNPAVAGQQYPMIIVVVQPDGWLVNGQVFLDGDDSHWVTSASLGDEPGQYQWPKRV